VNLVFNVTGRYEIGEILHFAIVFCQAILLILLAATGELSTPKICRKQAHQMTL